MTGKNARNTAIEALLKVDESFGYSNIVIDKALKAAELDQRDSAFCSALFYGTLEKRLFLDHVIGQYASIPLNKMDPVVREVLRTALYQLYFMDKVPDSAAVNEAVQSAKDLGSKKASGFVNGILRSLLRKNKEYTEPKDAYKKKSVEYSCPVWLIRHMENAYGAEIADSFLNSLSSHPPVYLRVNTVRIEEEKLQEKLADEGIETEKTKLPGAIRVLKGNAAASPSFQEGLFHVQDLSSQFACSLVPLKKGDTVSDVCAAPGGKTFTVAQRIENQGAVYSYDLYKGKVGLIRQGAERLELTCVEAKVRDAASDKELPLSDVVLCDAPCSGLGIIRRKPEIRYKKEAELHDLPTLQKKILNQSAKWVKSGGYLLYSTCTLSPKENGEVADEFLKENKDFEPYPLSVPADWERAIKEAENQFTLFPHKNGTDGFFVALFRKK